MCPDTDTTHSTLPTLPQDTMSAHTHCLLLLRVTQPHATQIPAHPLWEVAIRVHHSSPGPGRHEAHSCVHWVSGYLHFTHMEVESQSRTTSVLLQAVGKKTRTLGGQD